MPEIIPALIAVAINYGAYAVAAILFVASAVYNARQGRKAARNARAQFEAGLRDRAQMVRSAELPRSVSYGETMTSGEIVYARAAGSLQERLVFVLALKPSHEITGIDEVYFGERSLGILDVDGYPQDAPFRTTRSDIAGVLKTGASGAATTVVTLPSVPVTGSVSVFWRFDSGNGDGGPATQGLSASVVGAEVTISTINPFESGSPLPAGAPLEISWLTTSQASWIRCKRYLGAASQTADADIIADSGGEWTTAHQGNGVPYLALWMWFNQDLYPVGLENIRARIRGKKVYDPRLDSTNGGSGSHRLATPSTWEYSRNPALCTADYLMSPLGFNCDASEIDWAMVIAAANICDESVVIALSPPKSPLTQPRYLCDTELTTDNARDQNLQALLSSMAGWAVWSQGQWKIQAGAYSTPSVTLTEADLADTGAINVQARAPRRELFNAVKGVYVSPTNNWQATDYPPVRNSTYATQDGEVLELDLALPATTNSVMAQRLAKIELEEARQALTVQASFNLRAYRIAPGDIIALTLARYGFSAKPFRVIDREFSLAGGVRLTLRETAAGVYDWGLGAATEIDLAPNTNLPDPFSVPAVGPLTLASGTEHLLRQADGTVVSRIYVTWPALAAGYVTQGGAIELQFRRVGDDWQSLPDVPGDASSAYVLEVEDWVHYFVRARARNGIGVRGAWAYAGPHQVIGKTDPPANVSGLTSELTTNGILLRWDESADLDYAATELRIGATWASALLITRKNARTHLWGWQPAGAFTVLAKHLDTSGNESAIAAATVVSVSLPATPSLQAAVIANNVLLNWSDAKTTQPIRQYRIKEGASFGGATDLGSAGGDSRFETYFFSSPGAKRIWIQAEDVAGNLGAPNAVDVTVSNALGFKLRADFASAFAGTKTNAALQADGSLLCPIDTAETWATHFSSRGWANSNAQVSAGYPLYLQPNPAGATYQEVFDLGSTFTAASTITATFGLQWLVGNGSAAVQLAVSNTSSTGPWTDLAAGNQVTTDIDFRWVRVTITVSGDGGTNDLASMTGLACRVSQQKLTESGTVNCVATDVGGTTYTFSEVFSSVLSIQVTPIGTADRRGVADWVVGASNPTSCKVFLWDSAGNRVTGPASVDIEGFQ